MVHGDRCTARLDSPEMNKNENIAFAKSLRQKILQCSRETNAPAILKNHTSLAYSVPRMLGRVPTMGLAMRAENAGSVKMFGAGIYFGPKSAPSSMAVQSALVSALNTKQIGQSITSFVCRNEDSSNFNYDVGANGVILIMGVAVESKNVRQI